MKIDKFKLFSIVMILLTVVGFMQPAKVNAATQFTQDKIKEGSYIPGIWMNKVEPNGTIHYQQANFINRASDGMWVYCIQPGVTIDGNVVYAGYGDDWASVSGLTEAQWSRIALLSYYGYGYNESGYNHSDSRWYAITQMMIWAESKSGQGWDFYYTNGLNGPKIQNKFASEIAEINALVNNHYKIPTFNTTKETLTIGDTITLKDSNSVLSEYSNISTSNNNITAVTSGNDLIITANKVGATKLTLSKKTSKWNTPPIVYVDAKSQNVVSVGDYDPMVVNLNIEIIGGKVTIEKTDIDTNTSKPQGEAVLSNAIYGVYSIDGTKVGTIKTDSKGNAISNYLPSLGKFYVIEETPSEGYQLDDTKYYFEVTKDNLYPTIKVYEKVINRDVEITKVYAQGSTGIMTPEANVTFGFYDRNGVELTRATTDSKGYLKVNLPYGTYTVKQLTSTTNVEKADDFKIEVYEMGETIRYVISNAEVTAKVKVIKVDAETGKVLNMSGIKFKIFDIKKNEYICQTITYPNAGTICEFETDANGVLITPYALSSGKYRLEEVDQRINGYIWNNIALEFEIGEDSNFTFDEEYGIILEVKFANEQVKGHISIHKDGEELVLEDGTYSYKEIALEGVEFGLYAAEDIIINGYKYYSKGELVTELITDINGNVTFGNLPLGKYYIKELESANNNLLDSTIYYFELKYADQYTEIVYHTLNLKNRLAKGDLEFTKTDVSTGKPLPNTKICVYTEDGKEVFCGVTDELGKIVIKNLFVGKFYILETEAPEGYILNTEKMWFEITKDGEVVKTTMENEKYIIDVPNTLANSYLEYIPSMLVIIGTVGMISVGVIKLIKKKKENVSKKQNK